ncbi:uncharacterized protein isoform X1 [Castor canadensis]|uniref:Uncharacterized protein isoform X1 n=1 Tax=Castor canadensis TaxID=51338 RepID=A0AC58K2W5_CASCN
MVVRGRQKVALAPRQLRQRRRRQLRLLRGLPLPPARRPPRWDPAAAVLQPSQPPPRPLISICTAPASSWLSHLSWCLQGVFLYLFPRCSAGSSLFGTLYPRHPLRGLRSWNSVVLSLWRVLAAWRR